MRTQAAKEYPRLGIGGGDTDKPLNMMKRLAVIKQLPLRGARVLDCGCGAGAYVLALVELGADAHGIEYSDAKVSKFVELGREVHRVRQGDLEHIDFEDRSFDLALLNEVLEHVPDDLGALREVFRVLKPGGTVVIFSPNRLFPFETHGIALKRPALSLPPSTPLVPYVPMFIGRRVFRFRARNYFPWEMSRLIQTAGFRITHRTWIWQTFENISGRQPWLIKRTRPLLRWLANSLERAPGARRFGVSQVLFAVRP